MPIRRGRILWPRDLWTFCIKSILPLQDSNIIIAPTPWYFILETLAGLNLRIAETRELSSLIKWYERMFHTIISLEQEIETVMHASNKIIII